ncbi:IS3 family transposase [Ferrimicrobium acidiphilum]|uniref:IS3 family transposase n=1 Tax=Ferrimicrobium acidiphilum TaxID=121039 RepID=A0ABV3Y5R1_9ACTN
MTRGGNTSSPWKMERESPPNPGERSSSIFDWIQWYNLKRRHSSIDYLSPIQFEQAATLQAA